MKKPIKKETKPEGAGVAFHQNAEVLKTLEEQYQAADDAISDTRDTWEEKERIFFGKTADTISGTTKSQVFDPRMSTIIRERSARVMAQLPTGKVQAMSKHDTGKNIVMNMVHQKYVIPNADSQFDLLTKFRLEDIYSMVYGSFAHLIDYRVDDDYTGPDMWLVPIRNITPEAGALSINDANYAFIDSYTTLGWLKTQSKDYWKNIDEIERQVKDGGKDKTQKKDEKKSYAEKEWATSGYGGSGDYANVLLRTRYERDRWVTYAPDFHLVLRDIKNPQKNNEIPIVMKHCFPLLDRFIGLGEIEPGESLQKALNSLWNLYLDGVKYSIWPPLIINPNGVVPSSIKWGPAAKWYETLPNSIREFPMSPQGINTFQNTFQYLIASISNLAGTSDTTVSKSTDMSQGKTPQAIQFMAARESARDSWDRFMMEKSIEKTFDLFVDILVAKQEKPIKMQLFADDLQLIASEYPDLVEMFDSGKYGEVTIKPQTIGNTKYKYFIDAGTTMKKDEQIENQALTSILGLVLKSPQIRQEMQAKGKDIDIAEMLKRWIITSGVQDWEKIIVDFQGDPMAQAGMMGPDQMMQGQMGQEQMQQPQAVPQEQFDLSQIKDPAIREAAQSLFGGGM